MTMILIMRALVRAADNQEKCCQGYICGNVGGAIKCGHSSPGGERTQLERLERHLRQCHCEQVTETEADKQRDTEPESSVYYYTQAAGVRAFVSNDKTRRGEDTILVILHYGGGVTLLEDPLYREVRGNVEAVSCTTSHPHVSTKKKEEEVVVGYLCLTVLQLPL
ncbi:hypothetical protein EYF80_014205 [Liparis tanakae]|uniref:Uncharacterized protein n=1 Tax=Liparis tanakae TaxID=230148 RepID=A0A4Z2IBY9_9TELE|nr:hypothetical protein EYF80_014205 [Liparis tanakae]